VSKRKLLLADDSVTIQKVVNLTFADEGIEVVTTGDGNTAMEKFREIKPDLVMADVNMPGLNGYQICEQIKLDDATRATPVILLVGSFEPFDEERARAVGANDYLTKPFQSIRQLVSKVTELLAIESSADASAKLPEETLKMEAPPASYQSGFDDSETDDDMIQTTRTENYSSFDTPGFNGQTNIGDDFDAEESSSPQAEDNFSAVENEPGEQETQSAEEEPLQKEKQYSDEFENSYAERFEETGNNEESKFTLEQTGDVLESDEDYFSSDVSPQSEEESQHYFGEPAEETENYREENKAETADEIPQPVSASVLELDEFDLLDLPPIGVDTREETVTDDEIQPQTEEQEEIEPVQTVEETEVKTEVANQFSAFNFPPEVIEAIADKVVEKLSKKLKE
jgi:CheY-like chemotaxis protein